MRTSPTILILSLFCFIACNNDSDKAVPKTIDTVSKVEKQQPQINDERKDSKLVGICNPEL